MERELLPIGSVVLLKEGEKRLMICGRIQASGETIYDYSACLYPEGMIEANTLYFFNQDAIDTVFFIGFQDQEEIMYREEFLEKLGELEIRDGVIVEVGSEQGEEIVENVEATSSESSNK